MGGRTSSNGDGKVTVACRCSPELLLITMGKVIFVPVDSRVGMADSISPDVAGSWTPHEIQHRSFSMMTSLWFMRHVPITPRVDTTESDAAAMTDPLYEDVSSMALLFEKKMFRESRYHER